MASRAGELELELQTEVDLRHLGADVATDPARTAVAADDRACPDGSRVGGQPDGAGMLLYRPDHRLLPEHGSAVLCCAYQGEVELGPVHHLQQRRGASS